MRERRTQDERSAETRARLLDATIDCLVEYGYSGTTTPRIAEKAGVTRGAQVHHFGSKSELVLAAVRHLTTRRAEEAGREIDRMKVEADPLRSVLDQLWELHAGPLFVAVVELWVAGRTDPELAGEAAKVEAVVTGELVTAIGSAVPADLQRPMIDFVYTAMDALRGILLSSFVDQDPSRARRRWDRAAANLRRVAGAELDAWASARVY